MNKYLKILITAASVLSLASCSNLIKENDSHVEDDNKTIAPANAKISPKEDVSQYVHDMEFDEAEVLAYDLSGTITEQPGTSGSGDSQLLVTHKELVEVENGSGNLDTLQATDALYPGQVVLADDALLSGDPTPMNLARGKAEFSVNLPGLPDATFSVGEVSQGNVQQGIQNKINEWSSLDKTLTAQVEASLVQVYEKTQVDVELGIGIAEKLDIDIGYKTSSEKNTFIYNYKQVFYSVNVVMDDSATTIFDSHVNKSDIQDKCEEGGKVTTPPLLISSVSYGKMIYFKIETTMSEDEVALAFSYAGSVDAELQTEFNEMTKDSSISVFVYGGTSSSYGSLTNLGSNSASKVAQILTSDYTVQEDNVYNGKLLSFNTRFLNGNQKAATVVSSSKYIQTTYYVINSQDLYVENDAWYEVKQLWVYGRLITGYDDKGYPIFDKALTEIFTCTHLAWEEHIEIQIPAKYGQVEIRYDITAGKQPAFNGRVCAADFFEDGDIYTRGTSLCPTTEFYFDGSYEKK